MERACQKQCEDRDFRAPRRMVVQHGGALVEPVCLPRSETRWPRSCAPGLSAPSPVECPWPAVRQGALRGGAACNA